MSVHEIQEGSGGFGRVQESTGRFMSVRKSSTGSNKIQEGS